MENEQFKALLSAIEKILDDRITSVETRLIERIGATEAHFREHVYEVETRLLRAFSGWQISNDARVTQNEINLLPLIARQTALENRQSELERRFNEFTHPPRQ